MASKHEANPSMETTTGIMLNLFQNVSVALLYIIPSARNIEKAAVTNRWNYPIKFYELRINNFLKLVVNKEFHVRKSTKGSKCEDMEEDKFYQVELNIVACCSLQTITQAFIPFIVLVHC